MDWPEQVHKGFAIKDGRKPEDFQWEQWPISNLTLEHPVGYKSDIALICKCDMPGDIPQPNRYDENDQKLPDPVGIAFSRVKYQLYQIHPYEKLAESVGSLFDGEAQCGFAGRELDALWKILDSPGKVVNVCVVAFPLFMYLTEDGSVMAAYANANQGYFSGKEIESPVYVLSMNEDMELLIDGKPMPEQKEPEPSEEDIRSREEGDRIMREEREAQERMEREEKERVERENREYEERMEREKRTQEEAQRKARDEADAQRKREDAENQRMKDEAARERERLGIKSGGDDIYAKLTNPPNDDGMYMALVNLYSSQYAPYGNAPADIDGFKVRLAELHKNDKFKDAVNEVCMRLGWTL